MNKKGFTLIELLAVIIIVIVIIWIIVFSLKISNSDIDSSNMKCWWSLSNGINCGGMLSE